MISPIRYEVEIQEPLSAPVPMPPSMLSSEALVIWMFRIAMNAPIMAANTDIQTVRLARSGLIATAWCALPVDRAIGVAGVSARLDMASPLGKANGGLRHNLRRRRLMGRAARLRLRGDGRDHRHAGAQINRGVVERDLHRNALHHLGEIAGGVIRRQQSEFLARRRREAVDMA